ncbi:MAG: aldehyde dehydrogenase family protein [Sandaracinaceae bacterium]|nr:aldehyde dehydrogenase family protein [Sandaracinaceae bacterium]
MSKSVRPLWLGGSAKLTGGRGAVYDKFTGELLAEVASADRETIDEAIRLAVKAQPQMSRLPAYERKAILEHCVRRFQGRFEELAQLVCAEVGKPIRDARTEVARLIDTFTVAAEEATRLGGEFLNLEISPRARGHRGITKRVPVGPAALISPFNFPLNLAAHKIAPAIASGCAFILKPASKTPLSALVLGEILAETSLPRGSFSILPAHRSEADLLITDERLKLVSFTGSPEVGWDLKGRAGKKKVILELGGNAACIVDRGVELGHVVPKLLFGAYYQSGQSCISIQRIIAHESIYEELKCRLIEGIKELRMGDPREEDTFIGPLIGEEEAERLEQWIEEACAMGARLLIGGKRRGPFLEPTLLEGCPRHARIYSEEAFGPVAVLSRFSSPDQAIEEVNDSRYGLQAGIFTQDLSFALRAWDEIETGAVLINQVPSFRIDSMPYGGVKDSGFGREGVRYAIESMTEIRLLVITSQ